MTLVNVFFDPILPVFAITAIGFVMGRQGAITADDALRINRFAMIVLVPIVVFGLIARADMQSFSAKALLIYFAVQVVIFTAGYVVAMRVFRCERGEAILLAFGSIFANNVFFTLPIALLLYGQEGVAPIAAIVTLDTTVSFALAMAAMQLITLGRARPGVVLMTLARTPLLQALALGLLVNLAGFTMPGPISTFVDFNGLAAAPVALFAMGVALAHTSLVPDRLVLTFGAIKLIAMPGLVAIAIAVFLPAMPLAKQFVMGAAGPAGAMSMSLAMLYGVRTQSIAQLIIWTTLGSLVTIAVLA